MKRKSYQSLSSRYRKTGRGFLSSEEVAAYVTARMPATRAAIQRVLGEVFPRIKHPIGRLLDLGAGPGTGLLAAEEVFPHLFEATLVESNPHMISWGKQLVDAQWVEGDLLSFELKEVDLALFGYSYGELRPQNRSTFLKKLFTKSQVIVLIEPGTPRGYEHIMEARDHLLSIGGHMVAPCPHHSPCPMRGNNWCHFSTRVVRSKEHRAVKGAELGYEDEKFSYVAISREPVVLARARIVRHPLKKRGHIALTICSRGGIAERIISKKEREIYKQTRKLSWGDELLG